VIVPRKVMKLLNLKPEPSSLIQIHWQAIRLQFKSAEFSIQTN
jgi:hypothetical protein